MSNPTTPKPTPAAMEAGELCAATLEEDRGAQDERTFAAIIQTHACDPSYRAGQIAGLEWALGLITLPGAAQKAIMREIAKIARLKGEGGNG